MELSESLSLKVSTLCIIDIYIIHIYLLYVVRQHREL